jgi:hypothetical protein
MANVRRTASTLCTRETKASSAGTEWTSLEGQVGDRSYEEGQRAPGDWEAISSQRPIAIHALEHPMASDIGVYMNRKLIRNALRGKNPAATPEAMHARANSGLPAHCYTQNTSLDIPRRASEAEDNEMLRGLGVPFSRSPPTATPTSAPSAIGSSAASSKSSSARCNSEGATDDLLSVRVCVGPLRAEDINSYELVDPDGGELPPFTAGAHIDLHFGDDASASTFARQRSR